MTPTEKFPVVVEEVPFIAELEMVEGSGSEQRLLFRTNVGDPAIAGEKHSIRIEGENRPYLHIRDGLEARISRSSFYQLADYVVSGEGEQLGVWSSGVFFPLT